CGGNAACESACFEAAPAPAQEAFFTLVQCAQGLAEACPGCPEGSDCWYPCLLEHCGVEADACWEPAGDCGDILGCAQECGGVQGCMGDCLTTLGAAADKLHFLDLVGCVEDACAGQPQGCVQEALEGVCAPVLELCLGGGCTPDCEGMECGDDGCGGQCGACDESQVCVGGLCMDDDDPCVAACKDRECGAVNGCLCGTCPEGEACDGGLCIPGGTCEPGAYKQCVGNVLYWFDSCGVQGPPNEVCEIACVDDHCETGDPGTGDVVPSDAGSDTGGGPTVFPGGEKGGGCAASPASAAPAAWMSLLVLLSLGVLRRRRASRI
ncbi:MAG: hypothetical protein FJ098_09810, partial [Deltaproteobacteria bacterium]|nr:hypothetical protein [Deltaproteobacteria bacterium]